MRQLDLFGNVIDTPAEKKKQEQPVIEKTDNIDDVVQSSIESHDAQPANEAKVAKEKGYDKKTTDEIDITNEPGKNINENTNAIAEEIQTSLIDGASVEEAISEDDISREAELNEEVVIPKDTVPLISEDTKAKEEVYKTVQKRGRKSLKEIEAEADLIDIPDDDILFQKQYYAISEVAGWFRVNTSLLRFWENEFDILKPRKNRKGDRLFRPEDVKNLQLIYHLLREKKYTIEGAKDYLKTHKKRADMEMQLSSALQKFKGFLLDLKANLQQ